MKKISRRSFLAVCGAMAATAALTDNGMTIVEVDKDIFREAVKPAYEKLGWTELREQLYKEAGVEA